MENYNRFVVDVGLKDIVLSGFIDPTLINNKIFYFNEINKHSDLLD